MLLRIEIVMLIGGIYVIVTAKVPSFQAEGTVARLFGVLLMLPYL